MDMDNSQEVQPKLWENLEYGVLPIFCYNKGRNLGDEIALHFFEPRYLRLLRITIETGIHCFIYHNTAGHPQLDTTAYICSINAISGSDVHGFITNILKINQAWIDMNDRLWWGRFHVVNINRILPILRTDNSGNFMCTKRNNHRFAPLLTFLNHDIMTENETCELYFNDAWEIRMYSCKCTRTMKRAIVRAATNKNDPDYESLHKLPEGTVWYRLPGVGQQGVDCGTIVKHVETVAKEVTGSTTRNDLISLLVNLKVSCVGQITVGDAKADIQFVYERMVQGQMSRQRTRPCFMVKVDFGITKGSFLPNVVSLTPSATNRIFKEISRKVNEDRLILLNKGHACTNSLLKKLPTVIIEKIKSFLIYMYHDLGSNCPTNLTV